jgi:sugar phosphate isomerase/epimerase
MNRRNFLALSAAAAVATGVSAKPLPGWRDAFFLMDTWFWREDKLSLAEQSALMKKLSYAGLALSWGQKHKERLAELQKHDLKTPGCYIVSDVSAGFSRPLQDCIEFLKGTDAHVWLALTSKHLKKSDPSANAAAAVILKECADACKQAELPGVILYPHVGFWMEKVSDAVRIAEAVNRKDVGVQFNQYHWMTADKGHDLKGTLEAAKKHLKGVTINGSDAVKPSIVPLSEGNYDTRSILETLAQIRYEGPISHQGYSIKGNLPERLAAAMERWNKYKTSLG